MFTQMVDTREADKTIVHSDVEVNVHLVAIPLGSSRRLQGLDGENLNRLRGQIASSSGLNARPLRDLGKATHDPSFQFAGE